jgi:hypothetical protein
MAYYKHADECVWGHPTPTAQHRTRQGFCRQCKRQSDLRYRSRERERAELARALEGLSPVEVIAILSTTKA